MSCHLLTSRVAQCLRGRAGAALVVLLMACGGDGPRAGDAAALSDATVAADTSAAPDTTPDLAPDSDDGDGAGDTFDTSRDAQSDATTGDVAASEVADGVMCGSIACDDPPPSGCSPDRLATWTFGAEAACELDAGGFPLCRYPLSDARCAEGDACRVEEERAICAAPRTTCEVALGRIGTWISVARVPADESEACCFDFDGDGQIDNGLADLAAALQPLFAAGAQAFVDAFIQRGLNAYLLQYRRLDGIASDSDVGVDVLLGLDVDGNHADNLLGNERFAVRMASYDGPAPRSTFGTAAFSGFVLRARSANLAFPLPLADAPFAAALGDVRLDARVTFGDNGRGLTLDAVGADVHGARFGALFPVSEVYRAVNAFARGSCACLDLAGSDLVVASGGGWQCASPGSSACNPEDPDESQCIDLATYCGAALLLLRPDVADSISIGLWIQGLSAGFSGFVDAHGDVPECP